MALSNYTFTKHKTDPKPNNLKFIFLCNESNPKQIAEIQNVINAVYTTRDLINEPFSHLTAKNLAEKALNLGNKFKVKTSILDKKQIESLKMG